MPRPRRSRTSSKVSISPPQWRSPGPAASSNMGSNSIRALTPTLALLNVRLGYWLKQSALRRGHCPAAAPLHAALFCGRRSRAVSYENSDGVYLTDGGHIENLGVYELLRRRCKVIIVVDAEADAAMNFASLMTLQRYARIDLGVRIDLPWTPIASARVPDGANADKAGASPARPTSATTLPASHVHVAIGTIDYGGDEQGYLVYVKSSLNGDENDYIRGLRAAKRHASRTRPRVTSSSRRSSSRSTARWASTWRTVSCPGTSGAVGAGVDPAYGPIH